jgi:hypothetical protein
VVVKDGGTIITTVEEIYYAAGIVKLHTAPIGAVTVTAKWFVPEALGGVYGFEASMKADTVDITSFPLTLNTPVIWKSYLKTLLDWTGKASRHFFTGYAWKLMDCPATNSDITWTLNKWGAGGNAYHIEYVTGGTAGVVYTSGTNTITVTHTGTTTANAIITIVRADPTLDALVSVLRDGTGAGYISDIAVSHFAGGRDEGSDFDWAENPVLIRYYIDTTTGALQMLSGRAIVVGLPMTLKLELVQEADISFQGLGPLKYHTV